jgi:uncharacterized membrane protein
VTTQERFARRRKKLEEKLTRLDLQEARTLQREQAHDEQIARDLAGFPAILPTALIFISCSGCFSCCFLGVVIETIFCWIASGRLHSAPAREGPFNLIYGIGAVLLTVCLHPFIGKSDRWIFIGGSNIGGAFEYFCSWLQETVLGTVSWDYTGYPFNLNGRINLLYCLFWGALALVWVKEVFPRLNGFIERRVSKTYGVVISWVLIAFMLANSLVSGAAVLRQSQRYEGVPATHAWQQVLDDRFPDSRLAKIYPIWCAWKIKDTTAAPLKSQKSAVLSQKHGALFSLQHSCKPGQKSKPAP